MLSSAKRSATLSRASSDSENGGDTQMWASSSSYRVRDTSRRASGHIRRMKRVKSVRDLSRSVFRSDVAEAVSTMLGAFSHARHEGLCRFNRSGCLDRADKAIPISRDEPEFQDSDQRLAIEAR